MVRLEIASLQVAPLVWHLLKNHIASHTVEARGSRAPWQTALPPLLARVSVSNMVVVHSHALLQAAPTRWSASYRPATRTAGLVTAHYQNAGRLRARQVATVPSIPASKTM